MLTSAKLVSIRSIPNVEALKAKHSYDGELLHQCPKCQKFFKRLSVLTCHCSLHKNEMVTHSNGQMQVDNSVKDHGLDGLACGNLPQDILDNQLSSPFSNDASVNCNAYKEKSVTKNDPFDGKNISNQCTLSNNPHFEGPVLSSTYNRPFKCDQCPLSYRNKESLKQHYIRHCGIEPYRCEHCELKTYDRGMLMKHMRKHTGERPYICSCCGHGFKTSDTLKMHLRTHTGERPYRCDICGKTFSYKSNMRSHKKRHSGERPFKCSTCGQDFIDLSSYKIHIRRHTGEKPFVCQECNKPFAHNSGLYAHMKVHTGLRPFNCEKCGKKFVRAAHLRKHFERIHRLDSSLMGLCADA